MNNDPMKLTDARGNRIDPRTQAPAQTAQAGPSNAMEEIQDKLQAALRQACTIHERQTIFIDRMVGCVPQDPLGLDEALPEGELHQVIIMLSALNRRLESILGEQNRMQQIINT